MNSSEIDSGADGQSAPTTAARRRHSWILLTAKLAFGGALIAVLVRLGSIRFEPLVELWHRPYAVAFAAALIVFNVPLGAWRWCRLLRVQGVPITFGDAFRISAVTAFFNTFLLGGLGGDAIRAVWTLRAARSNRTAGVFSVLVDRASGLMGLLTVGALGALWRNDLFAAGPGRLIVGVATVGLFGGSLVAVLLVLWLGARIQANGTFAHWRDRGGLRGQAWQILSAIAAYRAAPGTLLFAWLISIVIQFGTVAILATLAAGLAIGSLSAVDYAVAAPLSLIANMLPVSPGGLGVGEGAFALICRWLEPAPSGAFYGTIFFALRALSIFVLTPLAALYLAPSRWFGVPGAGTKA